ncbi:MAG: insulinase family protein [Phycisphaerales bacterium]|nr:MAG: insulinase family protein [Phycisphaerales bacterium]
MAHTNHRCGSTNGGDFIARTRRVRAALVVLGVAGCVALAGCRREAPVEEAGADAGAATQVRSLDFENGARAILVPVPGAGRIAVTTFYEAGFLDEPAGMPQATHLLEHIVVLGATASYGPGESVEALGGAGLANAETMPDFTHYDFVTTSDALEHALSIEAERMTSLRITREIVEQEAPRCAAEVEFLQDNPMQPLAKFALVAANQAWRHGATETALRSGMESFDLDRLRALHRAANAPASLTVVLVGEFEHDEATPALERTIGAAPARPALHREPIAWDAVGADARITWDVEARALLLTWPAPASASERLALTMGGATLLERLSRDVRVQAFTTFTLASNIAWPVDTLPFFVYATVPLSETAEDAAEAIARVVEAWRTTPPDDTEMRNLQEAARTLGAPLQPTAEFVRTQAATLVASAGVSDDYARSVVLLNTAIQNGVRHRLTRGHAEALAEVAAMDAAAHLAIRAEATTPQRRTFTRIEPIDRGPFPED